MRLFGKLTPERRAWLDGLEIGSPVYGLASANHYEFWTWMEGKIVAITTESVEVVGRLASRVEVLHVAYGPETTVRYLRSTGRWFLDGGFSLGGLDELIESPETYRECSETKVEA